MFFQYQLLTFPGIVSKFSAQKPQKNGFLSYSGLSGRKKQRLKTEKKNPQHRCGLRIKKSFLTYFFDHDIIYADFAVRIAVVKVQRAIVEIFRCPEFSGGEMIFAVGADVSGKHEIAFKLSVF